VTGVGPADGPVLVTGSAGSVGRALVEGLLALGWSVVGLDRQPDAREPSPGWRAVVGDCFDPEVLAAALDGCRAVVHLAAVPTEAPVADIAASHVVGLTTVLEATRSAGLQRFVFASSNHAVGFTARQQLAGVDVRPRPDTFYGVGKVAGEALCSLFSDRYGFETVCVRIGSFLPAPITRRHLSTWLSPGDLARVVDAALRSDLAGDRHRVVYGISANTRGWWDLEPGRALGYDPVDDAEAYAGQILDPAVVGPPVDDPEGAYLGGSFAEPFVQPVPPSAVPHLSGDLFDQARAWLAEDPDPQTRSELEALLVSDDIESIADRFDGRLEFGTAGLRGEMGAGPNRMNRAVVIRAAAGLAAYVQAHGGGAVVVGYDARHQSDVFARDTAEVLAGAGLSALLLPRPLPTPVLAFAIRHLGCAAGVMVTASHNPARDNGYKVYLGDGSQIVPPADAEISTQIDAIGALATVPRGDAVTLLDDTVVEAYVTATSRLVASTAPTDLRVVYTPMHGVGRDVLLSVFALAGFAPPLVVPAQGTPDPDFPTVAFPNPEEPGALDLALAAARESYADLVIANDPDADRCAIAVPTSDGSFRPLSGDEVGALLAIHVIARMQREGRSGTLACSIVSSSLLGRIAAAAGLGFAETLTGFKWIARVPDLAFGYEEALGYCVDPGVVRDKDGISAALLVAELAAEVKAQGRSLTDVLDDLARRHGVYGTDQLSVRVDDLRLIPELMGRLRSRPPSSLGGRSVEGIDDLALGGGGLPATDGLRFRLEGGARVIVRPSGTEPKLKCYLEVIVPVTASVPSAREAAADRLAAIKRDLVTLTAS